jgi:hypothetical protein
MNRISEFYESNHFLIFTFLIVVTILTIYNKNEQIKKLISKVAEMKVKITEFEAIRIKQISKTIKLGSLVRLKYVLTGEIINILISENENIKFKNNTDIIRVNAKLPLAVALLSKHEGSKVKFKKSLTDEQEVYVIVLDVNNGFNSETETAIIENIDLITEEVQNKAQSTKNNEVMEATREIETSNTFFIRRNRLGDNIFVEFEDVYGVVWQYDHDLVYKNLKHRYDIMPCFIDYNCYTSNNTVPKYVQELDCVIIINQLPQ